MMINRLCNPTCRRDAHVDRLQVSPRNLTSLTETEAAAAGGAYGPPVEPASTCLAFSSDASVSWELALFALSCDTAALFGTLAFSAGASGGVWSALLLGVVLAWRTSVFLPSAPAALRCSHQPAILFDNRCGCPLAPTRPAAGAGDCGGPAGRGRRQRRSPLAQILGAQGGRGAVRAAVCAQHAGGPATQVCRGWGLQAGSGLLQ